MVAVTSSKQLVRKVTSHRLPVAPHILFFLLYNLIYFLPMLLVYFLGYSEGGAEDVIGMGTTTMLRISGLYLTGFVSFLVGTRVSRFIGYGLGVKFNPTWNPSWLQLTPSEGIFSVLLIAAFLLSKISLIPLGVYSEYAFDADSMGGPFWTFSMFCSEIMLFLAMIMLFSKSKYNKHWFFVLSALNGINLLHGTRVFFIVTVMAFGLYIYVRGYLPIRRILIFGPLAFLCVLIVTYLIYLFRESASLSGAFSPAKLLSPIIYESLFSQFCLITISNNPTIISAYGNTLHFFADVITFTVPRILYPEKADALYSARFDYLQPKGGFNGYAMGLIYFGIFFPIFYFLLGMFGTWLYEKAKTSRWGLILYAYFTADFLFRINRDGYLIPMKMIINVVQVIMLLYISRYIIDFLSSKPVRSVAITP
jgi:hypothetical protein